MDLKRTLDCDLAPLTRELIDAAIADAAVFTFDKSHPQHLTAICVYCTLLELARSEVTLLDNNDATAIPVILRSIFEAYADLRAVLEDGEYYKNMYAKLIEERIRFLRNVDRSRFNPALTPIAEQLDVKSEIVRLQHELRELKDAGRSVLTTAARFKAGNLDHEYESMYWLLCLEGHNNISALNDRHIAKDGDEYEVLMFKDVSATDLVRLLDTLAAVVIDATIRLHGFLETDIQAKYQAINSRLSRIRANYPGRQHGSQSGEA